MEHYLSWLVTLDISLFVLERCLHYLYAKQPLTSMEFFFFMDKQTYQLKNEIKEILENGNERERIKKFEELLTKHRPNREISQTGRSKQN